MVARIKDVLQEFCRSNIKDLEKVEIAAEISGATLAFAMALGLTPIGGAVTVASLPVISYGAKAIRSYAAQRKNKKLELEEAIVLACSSAYFKSFQYWLERNTRLKEVISKNPIPSEIKSNESWADLDLNWDLAEKVLQDLPSSQFVQLLNLKLEGQLKLTALSERETKIISSWVAWQSQFFFADILRLIRDDLTEEAQQNLKLYEPLLGQRHEFGATNSAFDQDMCDYVEKTIKALPEEKVFNERFTFKDIYIELKANPVKADGNIDEINDFKIEQWVLDQLLGTKTKIQKETDQIILIQAGPGRGKSVFCRMFADRIRRELYPLWIPIFIRLRDIITFDGGFESILKRSIGRYFTNDQSWLHKTHHRFLFLLDGFDELCIQERTGRGLQVFLQEAISFQFHSAQNPRMGHRVLITGRQLALEGIVTPKAHSARIEIAQMNSSLREEWLKKWELTFDKIEQGKQRTQAFKKFLKQECPRSVREELAGEPLLLYLLASIHRDGDISARDLESNETKADVKTFIYEKSLRHVIDNQRKEGFVSITEKIIEPFNHKELESVLIETGLSVIQLGRGYISIPAMMKRLHQSNRKVAQRIDSISKASQDKNKTLLNMWCAFYLQPAMQPGSVEFVHKSFADFFFAKRIVKSFKRWTEQASRDYDEVPLVNDEQLAEEVYDVFGHGGLSAEVIGYIKGLFFYNEEDRLSTLFKRLQEFFGNWCQGRYIDQNSKNPVLTKMSGLKEIIDVLDDVERKQLGLRQIDVYAGLNAIIIMLELHKHVREDKSLVRLQNEIDFHPCRHPTDFGDVQNRDLVSYLIGYSSCIYLSRSLGLIEYPSTSMALSTSADYELKRLVGKSEFTKLVGPSMSRINLSGSCLRQVDLREATLSYANLSQADLCRIDLTGADLTGADFTNAYLRGADLRRAILYKANLKNADLCRSFLLNTDLRQADLSCASVKGASLNGAYLNGTILHNIIWDSSTRWFGCGGLHKAKKIPADLKKDADFAHASRFSYCLDELEKGNNNSAIQQECLKIADAVKEFRGPSVYAFILNKFAWYSCLYGCVTDESVEFAKLASINKPKNGNYMDTLAICLAIQHDDEERHRLIDNLENPGNVYRDAIVKFNNALDSEEFQKLSIVNSEIIRNRRQSWISALKEGHNPFVNPQTLAELIRDER